MADNMADTATDTAAADTATLVAILSNEGIAINTPDDTSPALADAAAIESTADGTVTIESAAVSAARAYVASIETALGMLASDSPAYAALTESLATANGALALALADAELESVKQSEIDAATAAAASLPAELLAVMLDAIERKYAPAPIVPDAAPAPDLTTRRGPSDRTVALNAAASVDTEMGMRSAECMAAFNKDSGVLACTVNRRPNTRFSGMLALTPSGGGVANYADYDRLTRAIRHYLIEVERWAVSASDGQSVPEAKWLAARGRYIVGGGVKSALDCFHSGAEIAQYPDGRFRFAFPNRGQVGVRFLRTDNAAWQAFVGGTVSTTPAPAQAPVTTPAAANRMPAPTPPQTIALPNGGLASTARCQACTARNVIGAAECSACGEADWLTA